MMLTVLVGLRLVRPVIFHGHLLADAWELLLAKTGLAVGVHKCHLLIVRHGESASWRAGDLASATGCEWHVLRQGL